MSFLTEDSFLIRRKVFTFLASKFHVYDRSGELLLFSEQKAFKLKEDIRIYSDETKTEERLIIKARSIIDFSAAYDVVDAAEGRKVGALRRKGFSSLFRDSWELLDNADKPIAKLQEDSVLMASLRRFLSNLIPQKFHAQAGKTELATYKQHFNPFIFRMQVDILPASKGVVDPRLLLAAGILLVAIEGRQQG